MTLLFALGTSVSATAGDILRGGSANAVTPRKVGSVNSNTAASTAQAKARAQDRLARTARALDSVKAMQAQARAAAAAHGANNLGPDPNHPGQTLPNVPNGLKPGGLEVATGATAGGNLWIGANLPVEKRRNGLTLVDIKQTARQAILNWNTFNIGKETKLRFDQIAGKERAGQWIAFNKINDPSGRPSQILGSIEGIGQVYVINQNGILFGNGSQINLHTFVASSLPINDNLVSKGLLNNPDAQFLFSSLQVPGGSDGTPPFVPPASTLPAGQTGNVKVLPGAQLTAPLSAEGKGGRIMLVGANVTNEGTIRTENGQTILAAGLQVGVAGHASNDPSLRGLDIWVGAVGDNAGTVTNRAVVNAPVGSITISGRNIRQFGVLDSTTSVNLNGRIDLAASYGAVANPNFDSLDGGGAGGPIFLNQYTGLVEFGKGSVTRILPDYVSGRTAPGTELPEKSQIRVEGQAIQFAERAKVLAPNADVTLRAGVWPYKDTDGDRTIFDATGDQEPNLIAYYSGRTQRFVFSSGQIYLDPSSFIDVAGSADVFVPLAQSILTLQLRGSELADSPLQRSGNLAAVDLTIDLRKTGDYNGRFWTGTPLGDATGFAGLIERNVAQLTAAGGSVNLQAGGSIVIRENATVDVSGGYFQHEGGLVKTTRLLKDGNLVDIANADPAQIYDGIYTGKFTVSSAKWGIAKTYSAPWMSGEHNEPGYASGADGGSIAITAPSVAVDGELRGATIQGERQRSSPPGLSSLSIAFRSEKAVEATPGVLTFVPTSPAPPDIVFQDVANQTAATAFTFTAGKPGSLRKDRTDLVVLSTDLLGPQGFGQLSIENTDGDIKVPAGVRLQASALGTISLAGANVTVNGEVLAPGGNLNLTAYNISPAAAIEYALLNPGNSAPVPSPNIGRGLITLGANAKLSTAGLVVDDRTGSEDALDKPLLVGGGNVSVSAYNAKFAGGSVVDVSGGAAVTARGSVSYGSGGSISILAGRDPALPATFGSSPFSVIGGRLSLNSVLKGYSGGKGGSLALQAGQIQIGGVAELPNTLLLQPEFFQQGGFTSYALTGIGAASDKVPAPGAPKSYTPGIVIAPGTRIVPVAQTLVALPHETGSDEVVLDLILKPVGLRTASSLSFSAVGFDDAFTVDDIEVRGDVVMGAGSSIVTDPGASVSFKGQTVSLLGSISAPAGSITVDGAGKFPRTVTEAQNAANALPTVYIGPDAWLSAAGKLVLTPDAFGRRVGSVRNGGSIKVSGNIVAAAGAVLDVSGVSGILDVHPSLLGFVGSPLVPYNSGLNAPLWNLQTIPVRLDSDGGLIDLNGSEMLFSDATLLGAAGGDRGVGGTLSIFSGRFYSGNAPRTSADVNLIVTQDGKTIASTNHKLGVGISVLDKTGGVLTGMGYFAANRFVDGGFDSLDLGAKYLESAASIPYGGNIEFRGPVSINAKGSLRVAAGGVIYANNRVELQGSYVALGQPFRAPPNPDDQLIPFQQFSAGSSSAAGLLPSFGPGDLTVAGKVIDVGILSLQNIGSARLIADGGDIRGNGALSIAGDLHLRAAQIYPTTLGAFDILAYDHGGVAGSVTIAASGDRPVPLSAGGSLGIYASQIIQHGVLRAPVGTITIGWDGTDLDSSDADVDSPVDPITGQAVPIADRVVLKAGSVTSVSAVQSSGAALVIPFGSSPDGSSWIDPRGENVTVAGLPEKKVSVAANSVIAKRGSVIDLRGGGDLYAFRWISGQGGSVDILGAASSEWGVGTTYRAGDLVTYKGQTWSARASNSGQTPSVGLYWSRVPESYAVIPGFDTELSPFGKFNTGSSAAALGGDPGYVSSGLKWGDRVYLAGSGELSAGVYTLLPRRYALLPGAFLVTPKSGRPVGNVVLPEGAEYASGFRFNSYTKPDDLGALYSRFEIASSDVVRGRAAYDDYLANTFLAQKAQELNVKLPQRLPVDAGKVAFQGSTALRLLNDVLATHPDGGHGATADVSSFADIYLVGGEGSAPAGATAVLSTNVLSSWGVESLLVGGIRKDTPGGTVVDVRTSNLSLNNPGDSFTGPEITLVSTESLSIAPGSSIRSAGDMAGPAETFHTSGDGTLLRVSGDPNAAIVRDGVTGSTSPLLTIGADSLIGGRSVILDSSYGTSLDPSATLKTKVLAMGSGQISVVLGDPPPVLAGSVVDPHLVLAGQFLSEVQAVKSLKLTSYRTIDIYGAGEFGNKSLDLTLMGAGIRGFNQGDGTVSIVASDVLFDNSSKVANLGAPGTTSGALEVNADVIGFGANSFAVAGYEDLRLNASTALIGKGAGAFSTGGNLTVKTPVVTGAQGSNETVTSAGSLKFLSSGGEGTVSGAGLGARLSFNATDILANTKFLLSSGELTLHAISGDVTVGGELSVAGNEQRFFDLIRYSDAGQITLQADVGNVTALAGSEISVAAPVVGGNAGTLTVSAPVGVFVADGALRGSAGEHGNAGSFALDVGSLASFADLGTVLDAGGFFSSRKIRVRNGDVTIDGVSRAKQFVLSTDQGGVTVTGKIDASGETGGEIALVARGGLVLAPTAELTVHAAHFSNAGKGGDIRLEAGVTSNGVANLGAVLDLQAGAKIDLGVDDFVPGDYTTPGSSAFKGQFTGKLHLRAPRTAGNSDLAINPVNATILGASSIIAEGFEVYSVPGGNITGWRSTFGALPSNGTLQRTIYNSANSFLSSANYNAMLTRLLGSDSQGLGSTFVLTPGVEIVNPTGDLTLGSNSSNATAIGSSSQTSADWNLADFRFGPRLAPGILTLRAAGNLNFYNALSDGFAGSLPAGTSAGQSLWLSPLRQISATLPVNTQSWSYRLAAGSDLNAANFEDVLPLSSLAADKGSLLLGKFYPATLVSGPNATTASAINNRYQVIRTGAGDIDIAAGRDVQLRNQFATIYMAGVRLPNPTTIYTANDFVIPIVTRSGNQHPNQGNLGAIQQVYSAQWSIAGGDLKISAQKDIGRFTIFNGEVIADSSRQLPANWLYRRGTIDPATGLFSSEAGVLSPPFGTVTDSSASTTWWIDFSNFFEGFGALGGGDIKLLAGHDIINTDAAIPTNARMPGRDAVTGRNLAPDAAQLLEMGGGDLVVRAGNKIDGGSYYVERGTGELFAGGDITTNSARSPSLGILSQTGVPEIYDSSTWLPTTLFVGKSEFNLSARGNVLLGPVANVFLTPQGLNNKFWYKTYFNTYAADASVSVSSLSGNVEHRLATTLPGGAAPRSILEAWLSRENLFTGVASASNASNFQPWIRLVELNTTSFTTVLQLATPTLRSTAFGGDIDLVGPITLFPSPTGTLELAASGNIFGLSRSGLGRTSGQDVTVWTSSTVNVSDADPSAVPGIASPLAYQVLSGRDLIPLRSSNINPFSAIDQSFAETGSYTGEAVSIELKQALHDGKLLHAGDTNPVRLYAAGGDISGLTLFSPKAARVLAANDITDVAFYIQNLDESDVSVVSAGRDIIPYNENSRIRSLASDLSLNNFIGDPKRPTSTGVATNVLAGDIQINGPGTLEVFAGRDLDLGTGANFTDGTGVGITSIGNLRNPFLSVDGANLVVAAGVGLANSLADSRLDIDAFVSDFLSEGGVYSARYLPELASLMGGGGESLDEFNALPAEERSRLAIEIFYRVLRDAGRDASMEGATLAAGVTGLSGYALGFEAISTLFPDSENWSGEVLTRARNIRTSAGGYIQMLVPGGGITMASDIFGNPLTPPGIVTEAGGNVSIFTDGNVDIGRARIFTLRGGDITIWSSHGNIAAGTAPKTVVTAPPTRVLIDVTSADVETDLGGLATGGGIGVLASVPNVQPGSVDLIAPSGLVDAGDAGIRSTGNLNIAAVTVLNASNIQAAAAPSLPGGGASASAPPVAVAPASNNQAASAAAGNALPKTSGTDQRSTGDLPSVIMVEVLGYGGGEG